MPPYCVKDVNNFKKIILNYLITICKTHDYINIIYFAIS
jgi:hypothetical protein